MSALSLASANAGMALLVAASVIALTVGLSRYLMARALRDEWRKDELDVLVEGIAFVAESHGDRCVICGRPSETPHVCRDHFREDYPPPADRFSQFTGSIDEFYKAGGMSKEQCA